MDIKRVVAYLLVVLIGMYSLVVVPAYAFDLLISPPSDTQLKLMPLFEIDGSEGEYKILKVSFYLQNGDEPVDLTFNTSQKFDYFIQGRDFFYHFAEGKAFLQVIIPLHLDKHQKVFLGSDTVKIKSGAYMFRAVLMAGKGIESHGVLYVSDTSTMFVEKEDVYRGVVLFADVPSYFTQDSATVSFDIYIKNTLPVAVSVDSASISLDVLGGHGSYMAYTSQYDGGKYLRVFPFSGTLQPNEAKKIASFVWDQSANVRSGQNIGYAVSYDKKDGTWVYLPRYIVIVKNYNMTVSVGGESFDISRGMLRLIFPIFNGDDLHYTNVPDWVKEYLDYLGYAVIPDREKNIDMKDVATRRQVLFGVFILSRLKLVSVYQKVFTDVNRYDYIESILMSLKRHGIVKGYPDGTVRLSTKVTKAEAVALVIRTLQQVFGVSFDNMKRPCRLHSDVDDNRWYAKYICYGELLGLIQGYPDGTIRPLANVRVAELVKMLVVLKRYAQR